MILSIAFILGLLIGSFLNVVIVRLPGGMSIVTPPSHCPRCGAPVRAFDNVPILSFLLLRGRCRKCGEPISWRYPLVELMNALCYLWVAFEFGISGEALLLMAFSSSLIVITFIDLDHQIIPDVISLPGVLVGVLVAPFFMTALADPLPLGLSRFLPDNWSYLNPFVNALFGMLCGALPLLTVGWLWEKLRNIEAMGGGDIKLMAMVGAFLGWKGALLTIMLGALTGSVVGMLLILLKRQKADHVIPFGPFLAFGALTAAFFGPDLIDWYLNLIRI